MIEKKNTPSIEDNTAPNTQQNFILSQVLREPQRCQNDAKYIRGVAYDILRWARTPGVLTIEEFYDLLDVTDLTVKNWNKKYAFLAQATQKANRMIGVRREKGLITRDYDRYVASTLHNYLPRCKAGDQWQADLKAKINAAGIQVEVFKEAALHVMKKVNYEKEKQQYAKQQDTSVLDTSVKDTCVKEEK